MENKTINKQNNKQILGKIGEERACRYLKEKGYQILERNFRCKMGEIDIIAKDKNKDLVFVEVKTRRSFQYGSPAEAINYQKKNHIYRVAKYYILTNKLINKTIRFDAIEIVIGNSCYLHHIKQAF